MQGVACATEVGVPGFRSTTSSAWCCATGIDSGRFRAGAALPTEDELARDYRVSRVTVRRALGELAAAGLIERRQGSGTFVRGRPAADDRP